MVRKPGGCEESLFFLSASLKRLCQVWQKWTVIGLNETCRRFLKLSEGPLILFKIIEIPIAFNAQSTSLAKVIRLFYKQTEPMWTWNKNLKKVEWACCWTGVLLILWRRFGQICWRRICKFLQSMRIKGLLAAALTNLRQENVDQIWAQKSSVAEWVSQ